jgi:hypothetical protein
MQNVRTERFVSELTRNRERLREIGVRLGVVALEAHGFSQLLEADANKPIVSCFAEQLQGFFAQDPRSFIVSLVAGVKAEMVKEPATIPLLTEFPADGQPLSHSGMAASYSPKRRMMTAIP